MHDLSRHHAVRVQCMLANASKVSTRAAIGYMKAAVLYEFVLLEWDTVRELSHPEPDLFASGHARPGWPSMNRWIFGQLRSFLYCNRLCILRTLFDMKCTSTALHSGTGPLD